MQPITQNYRYRPEVDGLRAVAVAVVVLFHADLGFPGGFVGVDVFFVISGYLITSLIVRDLEQGKFTLRSFWERRARRIVPALVVLVLLVSVAGFFLLLPSDYLDLGRSAAAQAAFVANIFFWRETGYFSGGADQKALLHTWSLAVEEQFYLIFPLLLLGLFRFATFRRRRGLLSVISVATLMSFTLSVWAVTSYRTAGFYLLPPRAWEILLGALVAIAPAQRFWTTRMLREVAALCGLSAILIASLVYDSFTPFPGVAAVLPCLGAALVLVTTERAPTIVGTLLARRQSWGISGKRIPMALTPSRSPSTKQYSRTSVSTKSQTLS
jgi:peptidoglycan/LPS O-acetylase OafA/YrhL